MMSKVKSGSKPSPDETVKKAVKENPGATIEGIAHQARIARSTASKILGRLTEGGETIRYEGGRNGRKRLPDRFTLKGVGLPAAYAKGGESKGEPAAKPASGSGKAKAVGSRSKRSASDKASSGSGGASASDKPERLKAGGLDPLVLAHLEENKGTPQSPTQVAKALGRSSGAVSNCLVRLTNAKKTKRVGKKPLRYDLAA